MRLAGTVDPDGRTPVDLRLIFLGRKNEVRASFVWMFTWEPKKVIVAGRPWYDRDGAAELRRVFR